MKLLVLDNYDSFTYNLVHYAEKILGRQVDVRRNDAIGVEEAGIYSHIILSPGPGLPANAGIMPELIGQYAATKNILGICLGHQAIAESFGGTLYNLSRVYHGVASTININNSHFLFHGLPPVCEAARYHSWAVSGRDLPACFEVIATGPGGEIMGIQHRQYKLAGVQFHPESILTEHGYTMMENWLKQPG